jgi:putative transposase
MAEGRRCMSLDVLARSRVRIIASQPDPTAAEPSTTTEALTA